MGDVGQRVKVIVVSGEYNVQPGNRVNNTVLNTENLLEE